MYSSKRHKDLGTSKEKSKHKMKDNYSPKFIKKNTVQAGKKSNRLNELNKTTGKSCFITF